MISNTNFQSGYSLEYIPVIGSAEERPYLEKNPINQEIDYVTIQTQSGDTQRVPNQVIPFLSPSPTNQEINNVLHVWNAPANQDRHNGFTEFSAFFLRYLPNCQNGFLILAMLLPILPQNRDAFTTFATHFLNTLTPNDNILQALHILQITPINTYTLLDPKDCSLIIMSFNNKSITQRLIPSILEKLSLCPTFKKNALRDFCQNHNCPINKISHCIWTLLMFLPESQWHLIQNIHDHAACDDFRLAWFLEDHPQMLSEIYIHLNQILSTGTPTQIQHYLKLISERTYELFQNDITEEDICHTALKDELTKKIELINSLNKKTASYTIFKTIGINKLDTESISILIYTLQKLSEKDIKSIQTDPKVFHYLEKKIQERMVYRDHYTTEQQLLNRKYYIKTIPMKLPGPQESIKYLLDGTMENVAYDTNTSVMLQENMESARRIIDFLETEIFYIPNNPQRIEFTKDITTNNQAILSFVLRNNVRNHADPVTAAREYHIGNCGELSRAGLEYARTQEILSVEQFQIASGDHRFLVIGRAPESHLSDYTTWGPDAVVCDPWAGTCFPASEIEQCLLDYTNITTHNNKIYAQVTPFNPQKQTLQPYSPHKLSDISN